MSAHSNVLVSCDLHQNINFFLVHDQCLTSEFPGEKNVLLSEAIIIKLCLSKIDSQTLRKSCTLDVSWKNG